MTALPVLRGLRRSFPGAEIHWLVSTVCQGLIAGDPDLTETIPFARKQLGAWWRSPSAGGALLRFRRSLRGPAFDWAIDLQGLLRSAIFTRWTKAPLRAGFADAREGATLFYTRKVPVAAEHTVDRNIELARALGIDARPSDMTLSVDAAARQRTAETLAARGVTGPFVLCVPPTRWVTKQYPVRHWRRVVERLAKTLPVVLSGSPSASERAMCAAVADGLGPGVVDLAGQTDLPELVALVAAAQAVVCCDSAAKFIAPAVGRPCLCLLGPTRVERTGPYGGGRAIVADVPCQGCLKKRCPHVTCMQSIAPDTVLAAARDLLEGAETACPS